jgi:hypothetical protein
MIAEKTLTPVLTTRYVPATMVLTITSAAMGKNSSIEGSDGDSLSEKIPEATQLREQDATISFEGRRRADCQIAVEFLDPDGHCLEIY